MENTEGATRPQQSEPAALLRWALDQDRFYFYLWPKVRLTDGAVIGAEALVPGIIDIGRRRPGRRGQIPHGGVDPGGAETTRIYRIPTGAEHFWRLNRLGLVR